jgi:hypothetical protein
VLTCTFSVNGCLDITALISPTGSGCAGQLVTPIGLARAAGPSRALLQRQRNSPRSCGLLEVDLVSRQFSAASSAVCVPSQCRRLD